MAQQPRVKGASDVAAALHVFPCDDGRWAWRYQETEGGFTLNSNLTFDTRDEAEHEARLAYPDLDVAD